MNLLHWLLRAKRWQQNPPSARKVVVVLSVIAFTLLLYLVERELGWPDWATAERVPWRSMGAPMAPE